MIVEVPAFIFFIIIMIAILCGVYGFYLGSNYAIKNFLSPTCGMSIKQNEYSGEIESVTYYYTDRAYQNKENELKIKYGDESKNE